MPGIKPGIVCIQSMCSIVELSLLSSSLLVKNPVLKSLVFSLPMLFLASLLPRSHFFTVLDPDIFLCQRLLEHHLFGFRFQAASTCSWAQTIPALRIVCVCVFIMILGQNAQPRSCPLMVCLALFCRQALAQTVPRSQGAGGLGFCRMSTEHFPLCPSIQVFKISTS